MEIQDLAKWEESFANYLRSNLSQDDGSHDLGHFQRVWRAARYINQEEGAIADPLILLTAAYFHDLVSLPKNHPDRSKSSLLSAEKTVELLKSNFAGFPSEKIEGVRHAILAHSFSANIEPETPEAMILQDADRLEAVGAIGLARVFYTAGQLNHKLFHPDDPLAMHRKPDDRQYALDHFGLKLLRLPDLMNTRTGRRLADENAAYLVEFLKKIKAEIEGNYSDEDTARRDGTDAVRREG
jgi:uncharacterized protein